MNDNFGTVQSVIAPVFRRVARDERPGWEHPRKKPDAQPAVPADPAEGKTDSDQEAETASAAHLDLRV